MRSFVTRPIGILICALVGSAAGSAARQAVEARSLPAEEEAELIIAAPLSIVLVATIVGLVVPRKGWLVALLGSAAAGAVLGDDADRYMRGAVGKAASLRASMGAKGGEIEVS